MTRNKLGAACMALGAALVLAALALYLWNMREAQAAEQSVEAVMPQLLQKVQSPVPEAPGPFDPTMAEVEIDGSNYIGYLSIPSLGLELPVMSEWDYARLKLSPCRYTGSTKTDDLVVMAHNYARHFGTLPQLSAGDAVFFTDMEGEVCSYEVAEVEVLEPTAIEEMTAGEYPLTLFTCTYGGKSRVTVRCERTQ